MIKFDRALIEQNQANAPRYTSYPTVDRFSFDFNSDIQLQQLNQVFHQDIGTNKTSQPISLYIHIPFCNTLCLYCACNKIITNDRKNITKYLEYLEQEINLYSNIIGQKLDVIQLHFGGGSPSWLSTQEVTQIMTVINKYFNLDNTKEVSMEIDPRHTTPEFIYNLKKNGFNRISIGLQDLDYKVQKAVNRVQSLKTSKMVIDTAKECGFVSTNVDLIYGLPFQTLESFTNTVDNVVNLRPGRIALFNYAHIPSVFMSQTRINEKDLPLPMAKLDTLSMSIDKLSHAGYVHIGMDHFAIPDDELAIALKNGTIQRNFQGYSTFADTNMLAFGVSSIGFTTNSYYQNVKDLDSYYLCLENGRLPVFKGIILTQDDKIRKYVISQIMCQFNVDFIKIGKHLNIKFSSYFIDEINRLRPFVESGLIVLNSTGFVITEIGRFLVRNIAVIFDSYFQNNQNKKRFSKVI